MHKFVCFNQQIIPAGDAFLSAASSAALYGKGIFTTAAIYNSKIFQWEKHWQRLNANAQKLNIDYSALSAGTIENALAELIEKNNLKNCRARVTIFDESSGNLWKSGRKDKTSFLIQTADFRKTEKSLKLTVSPFRINSASPLSNVKSCNYLENILALEDAKAKNFDEAARLNEKGEIASACAANIFWTKNNSIFTPAVETGCLEGTMRSFIMENFAGTERRANMAELMEADEIFLTSAGIGIVNVSALEGKSFSCSDAHGIINFFETSISR